MTSGSRRLARRVRRGGGAASADLLSESANLAPGMDAGLAIDGALTGLVECSDERCGPPGADEPVGGRIVGIVDIDAHCPRKVGPQQEERACVRERPPQRACGGGVQSPDSPTNFNSIFARPACSQPPSTTIRAPPYDRSAAASMAIIAAATPHAAASGSATIMATQKLATSRPPWSHQRNGTRSRSRNAADLLLTVPSSSPERRSGPCRCLPRRLMHARAAVPGSSG